MALPESLWAMPNQEADSVTRTNWNQRVAAHNRALSSYDAASVGSQAGSDDLRRVERGFLALIEGIDQFVGSCAGLSDPLSGEALGQILAGFSTLINYEAGRLLGSAMSAWTVAVADRFGIDVEGNWVR